MENTQSSEDERIIGLEMKISYLEDFVRQLQEVVLEQGASLERLVAENRHIKTRLADLAGSWKATSLTAGRPIISKLCSECRNSSLRKGRK